MLFVGIRTFQAKQIVTNIYLDINPSICISLNANNVVLSVTALNEDGKPLVNNLKDCIGKDMDSFISQTVTVLSDTGYLSSEKPTILISVENSNNQKSTAIMKNVSHCMHNNLSEKNLTGSVITQQVLSDDLDVKDLSKNMHISPGKASFIKHMVEQNDQLEAKDLAKMNIGKLIEKGNKKNIDFNQFSSCSENISSTPNIEPIYEEKDMQNKTNEKDSIKEPSENNEETKNNATPKPSNEDRKKPKRKPKDDDKEEGIPMDEIDSAHRDEPNNDVLDNQHNDDQKDADQDNEHNDDHKHRKPGKKPKEEPIDEIPESTTEPTLEPTCEPIETPAPSDHREPHPEKPPRRGR